MKLFIIMTSLSYTLADFAQMIADIEALKSNMSMDPSMDRALTNYDAGEIDNYGCWCYFQESHGKGRGRPVDEIDTLCKHLHDGYTCAMMDAEDLGTPCTPWDVAYNSASGAGMGANVEMDVSTIRVECDQQNPGQTCANWACKVEGYFVQQFFLLMTHGGVIDPARRHDDGFSVEDDCPISTGIQSEHGCCNDQPLRFPFKKYDGARDCCYSHTYNTNMYMCCADGRVKMSCD